MSEPTPTPPTVPTTPPSETPKEQEQDHDDLARLASELLVALFTRYWGRFTAIIGAVAVALWGFLSGHFALVERAEHLAIDEQKCYERVLYLEREVDTLQSDLRRSRWWSRGDRQDADANPKESNP